MLRFPRRLLRLATSSMLYRSELSASLVPGQSAPLEPTASLRPRGGSAGAGRGPDPVEAQGASPARSFRFIRVCRRNGS